jgi:hypothetical protein
MNGYQKAQSLGLTGEDAEIVAKLQTLTAGPIPIANVIQWFDEQNLAELDPIDNAWVGSLVEVVKNPQTPAPLVAGLRKLFVHLAKRTSQTVDTTDLTFAVEVWSLLGYLIQMGVVTTDQRDSFYLLDGGRPYKDLTVEQFDDQRTAAEAAIAQQELESEWVALQNDGGINTALAAGDRDALKSALAAAIEAL